MGNKCQKLRTGITHNCGAGTNGFAHTIHSNFWQSKWI